MPWIRVAVFDDKQKLITSYSLQWKPTKANLKQAIRKARRTFPDAKVCEAWVPGTGFKDYAHDNTPDGHIELSG